MITARAPRVAHLLAAAFSVAPAVRAAEPTPAPVVADPPGAAATAAALPAAAAAPEGTPTPAAVETPVDDVDDDDDDEPTPTVDVEAESANPDAAAPGAADPGLRYSADLTDDDLARRWADTPEGLGSISVGFADAGRLVNAVQLPADDAWTVVEPAAAWGARETVDAVAAAIRAVRVQFPDTPPLRVNHISRKDGGYLRPHRSHQSGRDVDLAFYYRGDVPLGLRGHRDRLIDPALNWALVKALVTLTDVQFVLVDVRIQKVLMEHAVASGEDPAWVESLFRGETALVRHARRHRDHFHVRFFAPRSQELGRRVQPLLAKRPDQNLVVHRVRRGDTLGHIARRWGSGVKAIQRANGMRGTFLRVGRTLVVPLRGPCTRCPLPPEVAVPPRRLPPPEREASATNLSGPV